MFFLCVIVWAILFCGSYTCMNWRRQVRGLYQYTYDYNPTLAVSLLVPAFGIMFGLLDVALAKLGLVDCYELR